MHSRVLKPRTTPDQRRSFVDAVKRKIRVNIVADVFNISRSTVWRWRKRAFHPGKESFKDRPRTSRPKKITSEVELSIIALRTAFDWGTARTQQALISLPDFMRQVIDGCVQGVQLSRTAINDVLRKHGLNGYKGKHESWKFFRAKEPDELWQLDIKGPFLVNGGKYWFLVCMDDYSRYLLLCEQFDHEPTTDEITNLLERLPRKPRNLLTDNGVQFKLRWKKWCKSKGIKPLFAHPYYPQDKGKVERTIRNLAEEFVNLLRKFPDWLNGKIGEYRNWYNKERFHRGISCRPIELY
jgi:transposase-like protein